MLLRPVTVRESVYLVFEPLRRREGGLTSIGAAERAALTLERWADVRHVDIGEIRRLPQVGIKVTHIGCSVRRQVA